MIVLGITGGVGAGKSTVMHYLQNRYGAYTIQADQVGHYLMEKGNTCYQPILSLFGEKILGEEKQINRKTLGAIVFGNKNKLMKLNEIIHPAVKDFIYKKMEEKRREGCKLFVLEAALLLEEHYDEICDDLWYIYVDDQIRRKRLKTDRGYSDEKITEILGNQLEDAVFRENCKYVVENAGDQDKTYEQIDKRMEQYGIM